MEFRGMESTVVDVLRAQELQRLRRIRQLGLVHLVFPGAEHSRLVHSLGAAYLAIRFMRQLTEATRGFLVPLLRPGEPAVRDVAVAALCHDLGHGPLSHVWEREVIADFDRDAWISAFGLPDDPNLHALDWHELAGQALLAWEDGQLHQLLEQQEEGTSERVRRLLAGEYYLPYVPRMLASDVDVDRCDFVLRDAAQTGVAYGRYDLNWLISTLTVGAANERTLVVGFDRRKALRVAEQFLLARRALYETVYHHKAVRSAEGMMGLFLRRLRQVTREDAWPIAETPLFRPIQKVVEGEVIGISEILALDDYLLWVLVQHVAERTDGDRTLRDLARRLVGRDLFKHVSMRREGFDQLLVREDGHRALREVVAAYVPGDPDYYIHIDTATFELFSDEAGKQAYVVDADHDERPATLVRDIPQLRQFWTEPETTRRLFAPREALDALAKALG
jgi:HD superfamily phosphohydrolase